MGQRDQGGFSLAEVLAVCGLIGLAGALAVPSLTAWMQGERASGAARSLAAEIRFTQQQALATGRHARLLIDPDLAVYQVQVATSPLTGPHCDPSDYETVKRVDLGRQFKVEVDQTLHCLTFGPTGRPAWRNPSVIHSQTTMPVNGTFHVLFNHDLTPFEYDPIADMRAIVWSDQYAQWTTDVVITIDLGEERLMPWICPHLIREDEFTGIRFPEGIRVDWATDSGGSPDALAWEPGPALQQPYAGVEDAVSVFAYQRVCPRLEIGQRLRYLRLTVQPSVAAATSLSPGGQRVLAMTELHLPDPAIRFRNGRCERSVEIAPNTGRVRIR